MDTSKTRTQRDLTVPIPFKIVFEVACLPHNLSKQEYERAVRRVVRKCLPLQPKDYYDCGVAKFFSPQVSQIIRDVMSEN